MPIDVFKTKYLAELGEPDITIDQIRMFVMGKELKNDLWIYSYDIPNEYTVQVMIKKWILITIYLYNIYYNIK